MLCEARIVYVMRYIRKINYYYYYYYYYYYFRDFDVCLYFTASKRVRSRKVIEIRSLSVS